MKAYIGNKMICLAQPEDNEDQAGYNVLYPDGSETWLVKEIFDFEFRPMDDEEIQIIMSTVVDTALTEEDLKEMFGDLDDDFTYEDEQEILKDTLAAIEEEQYQIEEDKDGE